MSGDMTIPQCLFAGLFYGQCRAIGGLPHISIYLVLFVLRCDRVVLVCSNSCSSVSAFRVFTAAGQHKTLD